MATSPSSSAAKVVTASCPAGKKVLGTRAEVSNGSGQVVIDGVAPNADSSAVTANAFEDETGTALAWTLTAYAICADPLPDALRDSLTFPKGNDTGLFTSNPCPTGMGLLGTGGEIDAGGGQVAMTSLVSLEPNFAVLAGAVDQTGYGTAWGTTVTGICALHAHRKVSARRRSTPPRSSSPGSATRART